MKALEIGQALRNVSELLPDGIEICIQKGYVSLSISDIDAEFGIGNLSDTKMGNTIIAAEDLIGVQM